MLGFYHLVRGVILVGVSSSLLLLLISFSSSVLLPFSSLLPELASFADIAPNKGVE